MDPFLVQKVNIFKIYLNVNSPNVKISKSDFHISTSSNKFGPGTCSKRLQVMTTSKIRVSSKVTVSNEELWTYGNIFSDLGPNVGGAKF